MHRSRFTSLLCVSALLVVGCGDSGPTDAEKADAQTAAELEAQAAQYREDQEILEEKAAAAAATAEEDPSTPPEDEGSAEAQQGSRGTPRSTADGRPLLSAADRASFASFGEGLAGTEGIAVVAAGRGGQVYRAGDFRTGVAWSTAKVPVAMASITGGQGARSDLTRAITASDNAAAERLWSGLGSNAASAATAEVRAAGDDTTSIQSQRLRGAAYTAFGQTQWSLAHQARFVAGMTCVDAGGQVLDLMAQTVAGQRWGLGTLGSSAAIKGGWGPGISAGSADGWLDRQMGVVTIDGKRLGVAIATTPANHETGTANLTKIAGWLESHVDTDAAPAQPNC